MFDIIRVANVFYKLAGKGSYWQGWYAKNKEYFKELVDHHKRKRRKELQEIIEQRKNVPCAGCGGKFPPVAMDLIHRDPSQKNFSIRDATRLIHSIDRLNEEINKCDVFCANCVKERRVNQFLKDTNGEGSRQRRRKKLKELLDEVKSKSCADCGKTFPPYVLEFDHLEGHDKVDSISKMINKERPISMILEELKKTEPICTNCHRIRTYERSHK